MQRKRKYDDVYHNQFNQYYDQDINNHQKRLYHQYSEHINQNLINKFETMFSQVLNTIHNLEGRIIEVENRIENIDYKFKKKLYEIYKMDDRMDSRMDNRMDDDIDDRMNIIDKINKINIVDKEEEYYSSYIS